MEENKRFAVGYDLGEREAGICCFQTGMEDACSIPISPGSESYQFPISDLSGFIHKSARILEPYGKPEEVQAVVFSGDQMEEEKREQIKMAALEAGFPEESIFIQSREESYAGYVLHQSRDIWNHSVALFHCEEEQLKGMLLHVNKRTAPYLTEVDTSPRWVRSLAPQLPEEKDRLFTSLIQEMLANKSISSVYLVGKGFSEEWYGSSLKSLCMGKRVFLGNNLYSKGACYCAMDRLQEQTPLYLYLGGDKTYYNVGILGIRKGKQAVFFLLSAGVSWYEAKASCQVLVYEEEQVEFLFQPMTKGEVKKELVELTGLPKRPGRTTRLEIEICFLSVSCCSIRIQDLGFGELFPSSGRVWEACVELSE